MSTKSTLNPVKLPKSMTVPQLADILKDLFATDENLKSTTKEAIAETIWYQLFGREKNAIRRSAVKKYKTEELLAAVGAARKWTMLQKLLPITQRITASSIETAIQPGTPGMSLMPADPNELKDHVIANVRSRMQLEAKLEETRAELAVTIKELSQRQEKQERLTSKLSAAGRRGGRGNII